MAAWLEGAQQDRDGLAVAHGFYVVEAVAVDVAKAIVGPGNA